MGAGVVGAGVGAEVGAGLFGADVGAGVGEVPLAELPSLAVAGDGGLAALAVGSASCATARSTRIAIAVRFIATPCCVR